MTPIEQAIEALEAVIRYDRNEATDGLELMALYSDAVERSYSALSALRGVEQQPVPGASIKAVLTDFAKSVQYQATPPAAPVLLTEAEIRKWWSGEHRLEDMDMCNIDEFRAVVRAIESEVLRRVGGGA